LQTIIILKSLNQIVVITLHFTIVSWFHVNPRSIRIKCSTRREGPRRKPWEELDDEGHFHFWGPSCYSRLCNNWLYPLNHQVAFRVYPSRFPWYSKFEPRQFYHQQLLQRPYTPPLLYREALSWKWNPSRRQCLSYHHHLRRRNSYWLLPPRERGGLRAGRR